MQETVRKCLKVETCNLEIKFEKPATSTHTEHTHLQVTNFNPPTTPFNQCLKRIVCANQSDGRKLEKPEEMGPPGNVIA